MTWMMTDDLMIRGREGTILNVEHLSWPATYILDTLPSINKALHVDKPRS